MLPREHAAVIARSAHCRTTAVQPVTVDGKPISLVGTLDMEVEISETVVPVTFYITSDARITPILGLDVMRRLEKIEIDFSRGDKITFGKLSAKPASEVGKSPSIRRIMVKLGADVTIPARHEMVVQGKLEVTDRETLSSLHQETLIVEPKSSDGESIIWGRSVVTVQHGNIPVRVCNPSAVSASLYAGTRVGEAEVLPVHPVLAVVTDDIMTAEAVVTGSEEEVIEELVNKAEVDEEEKKLLQSFLQHHREVFSMKGELGRYEDTLFKINTGNADPIRSMPRPVPHHKKVEVDRQLDDMLRRGLIEPSNSEWASPILLVKKKDGTLRFCVDYRKLNDVTKHDSFPLPNIHDCLSSLGENSTYFSTLDMASGYWQMGMDPDSQEKAAFTTHRGLFKPLVQPFGPKGGVAHFSRVMNSLLGSMQWEKLLIYLDDILVFGRDFKEHLKRLEMVFVTLRKANLKLKPGKCNLLQKSVKFLGHLVSSEGISPLQEKISVVQSWPPPSSKEEVQSFLGLASYYRRFVMNFSQIAEPLNRLTRKGVTFKWDAECEESFLKLRKALINHPILAYPDYTQQFILTTDASNSGIGAILSQGLKSQERVVAYASRALTKAERNYSVTERECLATIWATDHYQYYLLGAPFLIYTDHDPLTYLRSIAQPQGRLARWVLKLEQYEYAIRYKPGKSIPHADALSRHPTNVAAIQLPTEWSVEELRKAQEGDKVLRRVRYYWRLKRPPSNNEEPQVKEYGRKMEMITEKDGLLMISYSHKGQHINQLLVPETLIPRILQKAHDEAGHFGAEKTLPCIRQHYYWSRMFKDVAAWCRTCQKCQQRKHPSTKARAPLQYFPIASEPGQFVAMDFVGPLPETEQGNKHMLVITDAFSKYAEVIPLPNQTAAITADALWWKYFSRHGVPSILHADQGKNFESAVIRHLCDRLGIKKTRTSGYHPAGNGSVERYNRTLVERISLLLEQEDQKDWERWIPQAVFDYHCTPHNSTGLTPFQLHLGRQPRSPFDTLTLPVETVKNKPVAEYMTSYKRNIRVQKTIAQDNLKQTMESRKQTHDRKLHYAPYARGDLVLCRNFACKPGLKPKLISERWTGPWKVDKVRGPVNYRITRQKGQKTVRLLVHYNRLKPYHTRPVQLQQRNIPVLGPESGDEMSDALSVSHEGADLTEVHNVDDDSDSDSDGSDLTALEEVAAGPAGPGVAGGEQPGHAMPALDQYVSASGRRVKRTQRLIEDPHFGRHK